MPPCIYGPLIAGEYKTAKQFLEDVDLVCSNALEYNPKSGMHPFDHH